MRLYLSSSLWGISLCCDFFRKMIDQKNSPFRATNNWIVLAVQRSGKCFFIQIPRYFGKVVEKRSREAITKLFAFQANAIILKQTFHLKRYPQYINSIKLLSNKRWRDFPINRDLNVEVLKVGQQLTLAHNIVSGHKTCCPKALRKLVSVSYSEEIFSSSRWIMEDLVGSLEYFFISQPVLSAPILKAFCTEWRPHEPMSINWCCSFPDR